MRINYKQLVEWSLVIAIAIWPFTNNIFIKTGSAYATGKWLPWTTPIIHSSQIIILIATLGLIIVQKNFGKTVNKLLLALLVLFLAALLEPYSATLIINIATIISGIWLIQELNTQKLIKQISQILLITLLIQISLMLGQALLGQDLGLQIIGEPQISENIKGIAKFDFGRLELLRSYGTFDHPNIASYFISFCLLLLMLGKNRIELIIFGAVALITASSRAILYLCITTIWLFQQKAVSAKTLSLIVTTTISIWFLRINAPQTNLSNSERIQEITTLIGNSSNKLLPWQQQPIHNSYLYLLTKLPLVTMATIAWLVGHCKEIFSEINKTLKPKDAILVLPILTAITDHFFLSLPIGSYFIILAIIYWQNLDTNQPLTFLASQPDARA